MVNITTVNDERGNVSEKFKSMTTTKPEVETHF